MSDIINYEKSIQTLKEQKQSIQVLKEQKQVLDLRFCNILDENNAAPKYYFADSNGNRISKSYYSIDKLHDGIHYLVSELDFMYTLGLDEWTSINGGEGVDDITYFRFHYGIVTEINGQIVEIVPVIYKNIWETNSNVIFTEADDVYELTVYNGTPQIVKRDTKIGCINLDINSKSYGMNIVPPIMDRICDFDLDYKGFAYASIGDNEGYLSKEIDIDRYNEFISLYAMLKKGNINSKFYFSKMNEALSKILFTEEEAENISKGAQPQNHQKKLKN